jgi:site-specific recombinase XerC
MLPRKSRRPMHALHKVVRKYLEDAKLGKTPRTVVNEEVELHKFQDHIGQRFRAPITAFTTDAAHEFLLKEQGKGLKPGTLVRKQSMLRAFGKWCVKHEFLPKNPVDALPQIPREQLLPKPYDIDELTRLLELELPLRDRVLRGILFGTGLRISAVCGILVGNISVNPPKIRVTTKGLRTFEADLPAEVLELILEYLPTLPRALPQGPSAKGGAMRVRYAQRLVTAWGKAAGVHAWAHRARDTFGTGLLEGGVDLLTVQELMGHRSISSTMLYTAVTDRRKADAIKRLPYTLR